MRRGEQGLANSSPQAKSCSPAFVNKVLLKQPHPFVGVLSRPCLFSKETVRPEKTEICMSGPSQTKFPRP